VGSKVMVFRVGENSFVGEEWEGGGGKDVG
jgi:hypothetical protein